MAITKIEARKDVDPTGVEGSSQENVKLLKNFMQNATPEQETKVYTLCEELAQKYKLTRITNTQNSETPEDAERSEYVSNDSKKKVEDVKKFRANVYEKYPDVDEPYKTALENAIYAFANNSEENVKKTLSQNTDRSDKNIEA